MSESQTTAAQQGPGFSFKVPFRVALLASVHGVDHLFGLALPPLFLLIQHQFGLSYAMLGTLIAARSVTGGLGQPVMGYVVDRFGPRRLLAAGYTVSAIALLLGALAPGVYVLLASQLLLGVGSSVVHPSSYPLVGHLRQDQPVGRRMAFHSFGGFSGSTVGYALVGLLGAFFGWRLALGVLAIPGFLATILILRADLPEGLLDDPTEQAQQQTAATSAKPAFPWLPLLVLAFSGAFGGMFSSAFTSFLPTFLNQVYGSSVGISGILSSILYAGGLVGLLVGGEMADRFDRVYLMSGFALVSGGIVYVLDIIRAGTPVLIGLLVVFGFFNFFAGPARHVLTREVSPAGGQGRSFGLAFGLSFAGGALGAPLVGHLADLSSVQHAFLLIPLLLVLQAASILALKWWGFGRPGQAV